MCVCVCVLGMGKRSNGVCVCVCVLEMEKRRSGFAKHTQNLIYIFRVLLRGGLTGSEFDSGTATGFLGWTLRFGFGSISDLAFKAPGTALAGSLICLVLDFGTGSTSCSAVGSSTLGVHQDGTGLLLHVASLRLSPR